MTGDLSILRPDSQDGQSFKALRGREGEAARKVARGRGIEAWREEKGLRVTGEMSGGWPLDTET